MATFASSLEHKSFAESKNLKHKLKNQLHKDIYKLYSESIFADIYINVEDHVIKSHRCILQTRAPTFYNAYCNHPDLIHIVPFPKLQIFIREIYCETEIKQKEEELLRCIDSSFDRKLFGSTGTLEQDTCNSARRQRLLIDLSKVNALNTTCVSRHYFRSNSDNSVYYSLVDKSLVLSDYSDVNEEVVPEMSGRQEREQSTPVQEADKRDPLTKNVEAEITCKRETSVHASPIVEHLSINDLSELTETKTKYFSDDSNANVVGKRKGKFFKFFIDASDLIDESGNNDETDDSLKTESKPGSLGISEQSDARKRARSEKPTPDSLDDEPRSYDHSETSEVDLHSKLADDFREAGEKCAKPQLSQTFTINTCSPLDQTSKFDKFGNSQALCADKTEQVQPPETAASDHSQEQSCLSHSKRDDSASTDDLSETVLAQRTYICHEPVYLIPEKRIPKTEDQPGDDKPVREKPRVPCHQNQSQPCNEDRTAQLPSADKTDPLSLHKLTFDLEGRSAPEVASEPPESAALSTKTESQTTYAQLAVNQVEQFDVQSDPQNQSAELEEDPFYTSADAFSCFKSYLVEKYECAKKNHTYSDSELKRLKMFDELVLNDIRFHFLKYNLEEILSSPSPSKTEIAMHKFLIKQYEKKQGAEKTFAYVKSLMLDILRTRSDSCNAINSSIDVADATDGVAVDDLFKKLLSPKAAASKPAPAKRCESLNESVTSSTKSCGFFIDLKDAAKPTSDAKEKSLPSKKLFSMFVDISNSTDSDSSIEVQSKFERRKKQYISKMEKSRELRNSVTSLNDSDESRRLEKIAQSTPLNSSGAEKAVNDTLLQSCNVVRRRKAESPHPHEVRRSWNVDKTNEINQNTITKHKRSYSVSENQSCNGTLPVGTIAVDINLNPEVGNEFPSIGNADSTNELTVNGESEISNSQSYSEQEPDSKAVSSSSTSKTCPKSPQNSDSNPERAKEQNLFVKLSDLDKEPKSNTCSDPWPSIRMTKSVTGAETNWLETKLLNGSVNSRSLSRIFPDLSVSVLSKPGSDVDDTTVSSISSVQSSSAVSTCESNTELSNSVNRIDNNTLGQDLLRMFLDEISTDVVVEVAGRRIKAHKCILTSRCQYFAALLSGGWVESAGNVLSIHGFSYNVVHFALCHIYSGETEIPDNINIVELATLADYLCLEGLKEIVSTTLKTKYCHFFHKPCNICAVGVLECLPVAVNYGLDDIHRKSLRWITKHYVRLWCSKAFASLPWELIDKCYNQHVVNMTVNNVFETLMNCDKLFSFIPQTRWAEPCFVVTKKLHDYCIKFLANHFVEFLKSEAFTSIATNRTWGIVIMDEKTKVACSRMRTDQLCQSYAYISGQCKLATATHDNEELIELLNRVKHQIEAALVKIALQASQCSAWFQMEPELRSHIQSSAGLTFVPTEVKRRVDSLKPRHSSVASSGSRAVDLQQVKSVINRQHRQNNVRPHEPRETRQSAYQKQSSVQAKSTSARQNGAQNKENKGHRNSTNSKSPFRNKYANVKSRYMDNKNEKSDRTASETTPSETSEAEKKPTANKRPSKSLVSSVHLSPAIRQTARAVSLSKIPVSVVRNPSQKRHESDKETTTSGSDNGVKHDRGGKGYSNGSGDGASRVNRRNLTSTPAKGGPASRASQSALMRKSYAGSSARSRNSDEKPSKGGPPKPAVHSYAKTTQSASAKAKSHANSGGRHSARSENQNGFDRRGSVSRTEESRSKDSSPDTKCPSSKTSVSEDTVPRPDIPFRRDGTFCIDEPTVLKKHSPSSDHAEVV